MSFSISLQLSFSLTPILHYNVTFHLLLAPFFSLSIFLSLSLFSITLLPNHISRLVVMSSLALLPLHGFPLFNVVPLLSSSSSSSSLSSSSSSSRGTFRHKMQNVRHLKNHFSNDESERNWDSLTSSKTSFIFEPADWQTKNISGKLSSISHR